jgi:hypothetical protein
MGEPTVWAMRAGAKLTFLSTLVLKELLPQVPHTVSAVPGFSHPQAFANAACLTRGA